MAAFESVLALLRNELWGKRLTCEVTADDVDLILATAEELGVSGLVANAILTNEVAMGAMKTVDVCTERRLHELKNREMNRKVARFAGFLNRRNLRYVIMKGQTMAVLYPHPELRSCGDIDFFCPEDSFIQVKTAIEERLKTPITAWDDTKHLQFKQGEIVFEMHSQLTVFGSRRHQRFWDGMMKDEPMDTVVMIDGVEVHTLSPTVNAVYLFVHLFGHFIMEGIGLKPLCDYVLFLHERKADIDRERFLVYLKGLGIEKAFAIWGRWMVEHLGLPKDDLPIDVDNVKRNWDKKLSRSIEDHSLKKQYKRAEGGKAGFQVLMQRCGWVVSQVCKFYKMAPREVFCRMMEMAGRQVRLRRKG